MNTLKTCISHHRHDVDARPDDIRVLRWNNTEARMMHTMQATLTTAAAGDCA